MTLVKIKSHFTTNFYRKTRKLLTVPVLFFCNSTLDPESARQNSGTSRLCCTACIVDSICFYVLLVFGYLIKFTNPQTSEMTLKQAATLIDCAVLNTLITPLPIYYVLKLNNTRAFGFQQKWRVARSSLN